MVVRKLTGILFMFVVFLITGCAARSGHKYDTIWPFEPNEPRIVYLKSLPRDFKNKTFIDELLGESGSSGLNKAYGVFAREGKIYVAVSGGGYVLMMDEKTRDVKVFGANDDVKLVMPIGVAAATDGTVFVSDGKLKQILVYGSDGKLKRTIGKKGDFEVPAGIAISDGPGRLYVADSYGHKVHVFSLAGEKLFEFGGQGTEEGQFHYPTNIAVDRRNGKVYVVDTQNFRVQVFDKDGKYLSQFGQLGDSWGTFSRPKGAGVDTDGNIYVADAAFDNIQIFNESAQFLMDFGGAGSPPGFFNLPAGMYIDENDLIYIVDSMNDRVQIFQYLSERWKKTNSELFKGYLLKHQQEAERRKPLAQTKVDKDKEKNKEKENTENKDKK